MKFKPKGIIFDYDGTLADTPEDNFRAWAWALEQMQIKLKREHYFPLEGLKIIKIAERLLALGNGDPTHAETVRELREDYARRHVTPKLYPETIQVVRSLKQRGYRLALASAASRERLAHPALNELLALLTCVVSGDDCKIGKPDPEPYLIAADFLKLPPTECLVIENAPLGIQSAKAAEMGCIALRTTLSDEHLSQADLIVDSLANITSHIV